MNLVKSYRAVCNCCSWYSLLILLHVLLFCYSGFVRRFSSMAYTLRWALFCICCGITAFYSISFHLRSIVMNGDSFSLQQGHKEMNSILEVFLSLWYLTCSSVFKKVSTSKLFRECYTLWFFSVQNRNFFTKIGSIFEQQKISLLGVMQIE